MRRTSHLIELAKRLSDQTGPKYKTPEKGTSGSRDEEGCRNFAGRELGAENKWGDEGHLISPISLTAGEPRREEKQQADCTTNEFLIADIYLHNISSTYDATFI